VLFAFVPSPLQIGFNPHYDYTATVGLLCDLSAIANCNSFDIISKDLTSCPKKLNILFCLSWNLRIWISWKDDFLFNLVWKQNMKTKLGENLRRLGKDKSIPRLESGVRCDVPRRVLLWGTEDSSTTLFVATFCRCPCGSSGGSHRISRFRDRIWCHRLPSPVLGEWFRWFKKQRIRMA